ncbi:MAG: hypothetical protein KF819_06020 [Labilithrix sp.]|nr:hypothetical protein [Labilithrix sp.]
MRTRLLRSLVSVVSLATLAAAAGCGAPMDEDPETSPPSPQPEENLGTTTSAIASVMGGADTAIDAPWRLEPIGSDANVMSNVYPPIPIVISLHDASMQRDAETAKPYGEFCGVTVDEAWSDGKTRNEPFDRSLYPKEWKLITYYAASSPAIREIERSDKWPASSDVAANHRVCRQWAGENCANVLNAGTSAEWHATLAYVPQQLVTTGSYASGFSPVRSGDDVELYVSASFAKSGKTCANSSDRVVFGDRVKVHLGDALPRFGDGYVYGDLHYHSQGTDNEGESAYAYRPTLQAMRAMGLDFVFATDHASDSGQVTDMDPIFIDTVPDIPYVPGVLERWAVDLVNKKLSGFNVLASVEAARDMNQQRFSALRAWLNTPSTGANAQVMRAFAGGTRPSRIFLGGEVDVVPEISEAERTSGSLMYGNGRAYRWAESCTKLPAELLALGRYTTADTCPGGATLALTERASEGGRYLLKDLQGLIERFFARQHLVWLPSDGTRNDMFVASRTSSYGGATQRLKDILNPNNFQNTMAGKGYAFLAHPVDAASGSDFGRLGPDIVPYSDVQLKTAFDSPVILGLQLWNEDSRLESSPESPGFPTVGNAGEPKYGKWRGKAPKNEYRDLHDGLFAWDKMLQWGIRPSQTSNLTWLAGKPRRVFMAGGSDAHGDWNYRREGRLTGTSNIVDTALGKPRNLVNVGTTRPESILAPDGSSIGALGQGQVTSALASGDFSVTDGPAIRIAIDKNNNGVIDDGDVPMGGITDFGNGTVSLIVEWKSTPEFQAVDSLDVYVGVSHAASDRTLVYAPQNHGIHNSQTKSGALDPNLYKDPSNVVRRMLADGYAADPTGLLRIVPTSADYVVGGSPYWGRRRITLSASSFPVGVAKTVVTYGQEVCKGNVWCNKPGFLDRCEITCNTPSTTSYVFEAPATPDRWYFRAFARTKTLSSAVCDGTSADALDQQRRGKCIERLAFSNPVWATPTNRTWDVAIRPIGGVFTVAP